LKEFVDGNFEWNFYTFIGRAVAKNANIGSLVGIYPEALIRTVISSSTWTVHLHMNCL
jgi:hypothetical protein